MRHAFYGKSEQTKACFQIPYGARVCNPQPLRLSESLRMTPAFSSSSDLSAAHRAALRKRKMILKTRPRHIMGRVGRVADCQGPPCAPRTTHDRRFQRPFRITGSACTFPLSASDGERAGVRWQFTRRQAYSIPSIFHLNPLELGLWTLEPAVPEPFNLKPETPGPVTLSRSSK